MDFTVLPGPASNELAKEVAKRLGSDIVDVETKVFPDGETKLRVIGDVEGDRVLVVQSTCPPVDTNLVHLFFMCQWTRRMGKELYMAVPYFGYSRQDKEFLKGEVVSLNLVMDLLSTFSPRLLLTFDFHNPNAISTFNFPVVNLSAVPAIARYLRENVTLVNPVCMSPDRRAYGMAKDLARLLDFEEHLFFEKTRNRENGEVRLKGPSLTLNGKDVVIVDDIISTGGSVSEVAAISKKAGARKVVAACTHALLVGDAWKRLKEAGVDMLVGTNAVPGPFSKVDISLIIAESLIADGRK